MDQKIPRETLGRPFRRALGPVLLVAVIFFCNFMSRVLLAPFLPGMEQEFSLSHADSGRLFLFISVGYGLSLFASGFVAKRMGHKPTVVASTAALGLCLIVFSLQTSYAGLSTAFFVMGLAAGAYLPSGIAAITAVTAPKDWGKSLSIHELAPNLSFILAPALAALVVGDWSWRAVFAALGVFCLAMAVVYARYGQGGGVRGESPRPSVLMEVMRRKEFWILVVHFCMAVSVSFATYTMLPLYLTDEKGLSIEYANELLAASRLGGPFMALAAGVIVDRLGARRTAVWALAVSGLLTILLGPARGWWLPLVVIPQPVLSVCMFPSGFTALSRLFEARVRNIAISFIVPLAIVFGNGMVPAILGWFGDRGAFSTGFVLLGAVALAAVFLLRGLRMPEQESEA
jgi:NNP family nitrate/nitrite transporter-like MFS transporter